MLEAPIDETDSNATTAVKALYSSCMNTGKHGRNVQMRK
jgi:hypothetical protein